MHACTNHTTWPVCTKPQDTSCTSAGRIHLAQTTGCLQLHASLLAPWIKDGHAWLQAGIESTSTMPPTCAFLVNKGHLLSDHCHIYPDHSGTPDTLRPKFSGACSQTASHHDCCPPGSKMATPGCCWPVCLGAALLHPHIPSLACWLLLTSPSALPSATYELRWQ